MHRTLALAALVALAACGPVQPAGTGRYLPLKVGASWTYKITDTTAGTSSKKTSVEALEDVGGAKAGTMAFRVRTEDTGGYSLGWQQDTGSETVRHHDQQFDTAGKQLNESWYTPSKLRLDETDAHLKQGVTWNDTYTEKNTDNTTNTTTTVSKTETWTVESADELLTVPAGTFHALRLHRTGTTAGQSDKRYWYARGVGKLKETGGTRTEELQSFTLP